MFEIQYLGHAGWSIKNNGIKILCDPWLNPDGTFFSSWLQFPRIDNVDIKEITKDVDVLYISHSHADHYDPWTLQKINKDVQVCIPKFKDFSLKYELKSMGFTNILEMEEDDTYFKKNLKIKIFKEEDYLDKDSCIYVEDEHSTILNLNDCHLKPEKFKEMKQIDVLMLQCSSALWWPCVYNYEEEKMNSVCEKKREGVLKRSVNYAKWTKAKNIIPCAGPPIFSGVEESRWNHERAKKHNPFPLMDEGVQYIKDSGHNAHLVIPNDIIKLDKKQIEFLCDTEESHKIYQNVDEYINKYVKEKRLELKKGVATVEIKSGYGAEDLLRYRTIQVVKNSKIYKNKLNYPILFEIDGNKWVVNFSEDEERCFKKYENEDCRYHFSFDGALLAHILGNKFIDFDYYFLSLKFKAYRRPDEYDDILFALLRNMDNTRLRISESLYNQRVSTEENFILEHKGDKYKVQKYCPHMLADLETTGFVDENDNLVCPLHNWKFNLKTGECKNSKKRRLCVERLK
tara:strand:- start:13694 stop:15235 length:1542 start_codon:yes stop_codon:yes gene_type:complete